MLADNVGHGDIGAYGGGVIRGMPTPRLDRLAAEGMQLTLSWSNRVARHRVRRLLTSSSMYSKLPSM